MLQYIALVLNDYEKECDREKPKASFLKEFKYPPVLPIVFYDGPGNWTAERNFLDKTEFSEVFHKYIPREWTNTCPQIKCKWLKGKSRPKFGWRCL